MVEYIRRIQIEFMFLVRASECHDMMPCIIDVPSGTQLQEGAKYNPAGTPEGVHFGNRLFFPPAGKAER